MKTSEILLYLIFFTEFITLWERNKDERLNKIKIMRRYLSMHIPHYVKYFVELNLLILLLL